ncbi:hypothetical protein IWX64_000896 [Arthrobacter sp. CAN_A212]
MDELPMLRFKECGNRSRLVQGGNRLLGPDRTVLGQFTAPQLNLTGPILRIDDHYAARPDKEVIEVGLWPARPVHIVQSKPAVTCKQIKAVGHQQLTRSASVPRPFGTLSVLNLLLQALNGHVGVC